MSKEEKDKNQKAENEAEADRKKNEFKKENLILKTLPDVVSREINCQSPENDLFCYPNVILFNSETKYKKPSFVKITIMNLDPFPVIYSIKTRHKLFRIYKNNCGLLKSQEKRVLKLFLLPCDEWPLSVNDYLEKQIKIAVENLRIPDCIQPETRADTIAICRYLWRRSTTDWCHERFYTKLTVCLEKFQENSNSQISTPNVVATAAATTTAPTATATKTETTTATKTETTKSELT